MRLLSEELLRGMGGARMHLTINLVKLFGSWKQLCIEFRSKCFGINDKG